MKQFFINIFNKASLFVLLVCNNTQASTPKERNYILDIKQTSHYTGCIDGFIALQELGLYKRPDSLNGYQVFKMVKENCNKKSLIYRKEQDNFWGKDND